MIAEITSPATRIVVSVFMVFLLIVSFFALRNIDEPKDKIKTEVVKE